METVPGGRDRVLEGTVSTVDQRERENKKTRRSGKEELYRTMPFIESASQVEPDSLGRVQKSWTDLE